jgi:hypothetical protein
MRVLRVNTSELGAAQNELTLKKDSILSFLSN